MYVGLQDLNDYQQAYLAQKDVHCEVNADWTTRLESIQAFVSQFKHLAVHFATYSMSAISTTPTLPILT